MISSPDSAALSQQSAPGEPVLIFDGVSIGFEDNQVLKDISFTVGKGETRILLGPAGSGKSVLLKLANGLLKPDAGRITVFGEEISRIREEEMFRLRHRIGMVFQEGALFDSLTVRDNVAYRLMESRVPEEEATRRAEEALRFVELDHTLEKFPPELSGGMRRRVAIARAIISRPDFILYDSPTGGLDPITSNTIIELVMKQRDVYGTSSLLVTHRLQDAFTLATHSFDRAQNHMTPIPPGGPLKGLDLRTSFLVLHEGRLIFDGSTRDLVLSSDPFIREYFA